VGWVAWLRLRLRVGLRRDVVMNGGIGRQCSGDGEIFEEEEPERL